jgi:transcriptional regulator with XRE-family HTH domain
VYELKEESAFDDGFSQRKIASKAGISVSTVSEHKTFLTKSVKLLYEAEGGGLTLVADAESSWWDKGDLLVGFPRPDQVRAWWEELSAEHTEHPDDEGRTTLAYAEKGARHSTEHPPNATEHLPMETETNGGIRQESEHVQQGSEQENGLGKLETSPENVVFGMFGGFEGKERSEILAEGVRRLFEEHPEYRERRPGQVGCRLHMGRYTPFAPTDEEVEAVIEEMP